jgi:hypothetical protein
MKYKARVSHFIQVITQVYLPIYSESYHNINGEWVSIDDLDEKNIRYRKFDLDKISRFIKPENDHRGFKSDYCIVELYNGETYPIHGSAEEWERQYDDLHETNNSLYKKMHDNFRKVLEE